MGPDLTPIFGSVCVGFAFLNMALYRWPVLLAWLGLDEKKDRSYGLILEWLAYLMAGGIFLWSANPYELPIAIYIVVATAVGGVAIGMLAWGRWEGSRVHQLTVAPTLAIVLQLAALALFTQGLWHLTGILVALSWATLSLPIVVLVHFIRRRVIKR